MFKLIGRLVIVGVCFVAALGSPASAHEAAKGSPYIKITKGQDGQRDHLQTSVVRFRSSADPDLMVDLVGVVHVGAKTYYEKLDEHLNQYEVVLYEMVAPKGMRPVKGKSGYPALAKALKLASQLDFINYDRPSFVHADMSPEEVSLAFKKRGLKEPKMGLEMLLAPLVVKVIGADYAQALLAGLLAEDRKPSRDHAVIIEDRNEVVMKVLAEQLSIGQKNIAIFYGVGHMRDFEKRLFDSHGLVPADATWYTAWEVPTAKIGSR